MLQQRQGLSTGLASSVSSSKTATLTGRCVYLAFSSVYVYLAFVLRVGVTSLLEPTELAKPVEMPCLRRNTQSQQRHETVTVVSHETQHAEERRGNRLQLLQLVQHRLLHEPRGSRRHARQPRHSGHQHGKHESA